MQVMDHEPQAWYLLKFEHQLLLDVNCNHGPVGYSVLIRLNPDEQADYSLHGHHYLNQLAEQVQNTGPGQTYQLRDVSTKYAQATLEAIKQWQSEQGIS